MFELLKEQPKDPILGLSTLYRADPRDTKIDLGVGVYKNAEGTTPIMRAVKKAEEMLWKAETTKTYTSLPGQADYHAVMHDLVLGDAVPSDRTAYCATPGGTGAVHHILELIAKTKPEAKVWFSNPTWGNHMTIAKHVGAQFGQYRYFDEETRAVNFAAMKEDLSAIAAGDVVVLHGCCHNPTGANLTQAQWKEVGEILTEKNAIPFIDIAYQGFGDGLDEDAFGTRHLASKFDNMFISASCSKNFGIYRERTGIIFVICKDADQKAIVQGNLNHLNRQNFSFPPDHGASLVTLVLSDATLRKDWEAELEEVRLGMRSIREKLAAALNAEAGSNRFGFLAEHRGMFSRLGASKDKVDRLREEHGIYMVGDSRLNIAGVTEATIDRLAKAVIEVGI
ncbi:MAG: amino acid aminotransferase [Pseudomonadota bacterium]